jgi:tetratricopeptide (TPR) repeat protein
MPDEAINAFQNAIKNDPRSAYAYYGIGTVYARQGQHQAAINAFDHALSINSHLDRPWAGKGDVYLSMGELEKARECFYQALENNIWNVNAQKGLAQINIMEKV